MKGIVLAGGSGTRLKKQYGQYLLKVIDEIKETGNPNLD
jgi:dTDP-glucose pyrophosphorylase